MESCIFCLRNALSTMNYSPAFRKQEFQTIIGLYKRILEAKQLEIHTGILSEILQFCQNTIDNNDSTFVVSPPSRHA